MSKRLRVMLVDDQTLFRKGIASLLASRPGVEVVAEASDGLEAIDRAHETRPDLILMDIRMPRCSGLEATAAIKRDLPQVHILMLTISDEDEDLFAAIKSGAEGYLLKNLQTRQLYEALDAVRQGEVILSGPIAARILQELRRPSPPPKQPAADDELTPREADILKLLVRGASNKEIASALCIAESTVKLHLGTILQKLQVQNRVQAAVYAVRKGLVSDAPEGAGRPE